MVGILGKTKVNIQLGEVGNGWGLGRDGHSLSSAPSPHDAKGNGELCLLYFNSFLEV